jgi:hypothetical protein
LAIFTAIRLASSLLSNLGADRRPGILEVDVIECLTVVVTHDEVCGLFFDGPDSR